MKLSYLAIILVCYSCSATSQPYGEKMASTVLRKWGDSVNFRVGRPIHWTYDRGVILKGFEYLWYNTGNPVYYNTIKTSMDAFLDAEGNIKGYSKDEFNIDHILSGRSMLTLYKVTGEKKYYNAVVALRNQLKEQPRTHEGGFWHKKRYPWQMWLDGLYMGQPFYAEYAATFHEDTAFNDIANQFIWMENHSRDAASGLLYHGWDESKEQQWADKTTGQSANFWGRAMGWYGMALVDVLEYFPKDHPKQKTLIGILNRFSEAIKNVQDKQSGLWWDVLDKPGYKNNYTEASASCMLVYTLAKAVRNGWLPEAYLPLAEKGYQGIISKFVSTEPGGYINLEGTVSVSGLGGDPYRDGSFEYYMSEKVIQNDPKGVGAFIKCASEMEMIPTLKKGKGKTVALDYYFNHEIRKDITGTPVQWHYVWDEMDNNGFSLLGHVFNSYGVKTTALEAAPTSENLKDKQFYIIVDPDNKKDNPNPNYMTDEAAAAVYDWVSRGGVLVLLANDSANSDLAHFNKLASRFGITFTDKSMNMVVGNDYPMGAVRIASGNEVFKNVNKVYLKELAALSVTKPANAIVTKDGEHIIAVAEVGKGAVLAAGDPWLYNEYTDGRKIPAEYQNFGAANDLVAWMIKMSPAK